MLIWLASFRIPHIVGGFIAVITLAAIAQAAAPEDVRCQQLRDMAVAWAGVLLTPEQKTIRRGLVRWYVRHCRRENVQL